MSKDFVQSHQCIPDEYAGLSSEQMSRLTCILFVPGGWMTKFEDEFLCIMDVYP